MIVFPYKVTRKTSFPIFFPWFVVPEPGYRRRGLGLEAARLMMAFGESVIGPVFITITVTVVFWVRGMDTKGEIVRVGSHLRTSRMLTSTLHSFVVCMSTPPEALRVFLYRCETVHVKYGFSVFLRGTLCILLSINVLAADIHMKYHTSVRFLCQNRSITFCNGI